MLFYALMQQLKLVLLPEDNLGVAKIHHFELLRLRMRMRMRMQLQMQMQMQTSQLLLACE